MNVSFWLSYSCFFLFLVFALFGLKDRIIPAVRTEVDRRYIDEHPEDPGAEDRPEIPLIDSHPNPKVDPWFHAVLAFLIGFICLWIGLGCWAAVHSWELRYG